MDKFETQIITLELITENVIKCAQLLKENGYQVKVKENTGPILEKPVQDKVTHQNKKHYWQICNEKYQKKYKHANQDNVISLELGFGQTTKINRDSELVEETCAYLNKHLCRKFILDDIATLVGSNRTKLAATFKRVLGLGVFEWLRKQRMLKAKKLLLNSELSIQEIGFEIGYENSANFSSAYKKQFNLSPRQQRNRSKVEIVTLSKVLNT